MVATTPLIATTSGYDDSDCPLPDAAAGVPHGHTKYADGRGIAASAPDAMQRAQPKVEQRSRGSSSSLVGSSMASSSPVTRHCVPA